MTFREIQALPWYQENRRMILQYLWDCRKRDRYIRNKYLKPAFAALNKKIDELILEAIKK